MRNGFFVLVACMLCLPLACNAQSIMPEQRACMKDADCTVIDVGCTCGCVYEGSNDAVNLANKEAFAHYLCSNDDQVKKCSEAGACAAVQTPVAVCKEHLCKVILKPINR